MALVLKSIYKGYNYYFNELKDPRSEHFPLLGSPWPIAGIVFSYLYFCLNCGPKWMEKRQAFELKTIMMVYNFLQIIANLVLGIKGMSFMLKEKDYSFICQPLNMSSSVFAMTEVNLTYVYFLLKISDLLDTVFFVLRKKNANLSFLHIYHHTGMVVAAYIFSKFIPGGHASLLGVINCFVHAFMYLYYFLTAFKAELKQSIWWKKHITHVQMIQFAILIFHFGRPAIFGYACDYPVFWMWVGFIQNLFMFTLFSDFYLKAYVKKRKV